ncbi:SH3 domain-containing protein [Butyricicoccus sp. 1XD8-22]|nr:SH3 domain-containing protein [Butyricicoccus sp. 1XD8-22]
MNLKRNLLSAAMALTLMTAYAVPAFAAEPVQNTAASENGGASLYTYKYIVVGNDVRVRATPGLSGTVLGHMQWGGVVYDTGRVADVDGYHWMQVRCGAPLTGTIGWIASDYLMQDPDD